MKSDDAEEVEFFEVTQKQEEVLEVLSDDSIKLPERHPSNDEPGAFCTVTCIPDDSTSAVSATSAAATSSNPTITVPVIHG